MGFFDAMKVHLFSEMKGVVTLEGKPVKGAVITRTAISNDDKEHTDSTITDSAGRFHFGRMETHLFLKLLPTSIGTYQKVIIDYDGKQYRAWKIGDAYDRNNGELNDRDVIGTDKEIDIDLKCELTAEDTSKKGGAHTKVVFGICTWEGQIAVE